MNTEIQTTEHQFGAAMAAYGLHPSEIIADGVRRRFDADDEKRGKKSAWYVLHGNGVPAGAFGNWKTGLSEKWCSKADAIMTQAERDEYRRRVDKARQETEFARLEEQRLAGQVCERIWAGARDATADHPYCIAKGIKPYGLKEFKDKRTLIVPIRNEGGVITSLQFIDADGVKRFKSHGRIDGCYCAFGGRVFDTLLLCEGFATGASLHQATGYPVAVAFNAGNLLPVAKILRTKMPGVTIIVCADNDRFSASGNIGRDRALAAASAVGGLLALPAFQSDEGSPTDFNDLLTREGAQAVIDALEAAVRITAQNCAARSAPAAEPVDQRFQRTVNLRCGANIVPQPITWLWPEWLPAGKLTILAGSAGTGKTTLALGLAATLTCGGKWPDATPCHQRGNVLIWSSEDSADDTLVPRLIASGADLAKCHFIEGITENGEKVPFDPAQDIGELHKAVERIGGVSLLIVDPIVSAVSGDMHRANDVRRSLQAVVDFAEVHGCAVIGITHFAKGGVGKSPQDRVIGSQAFGALARMVLVAAKEEDGLRRVLARAKSNIAPDDGGAAYSIELTTIDGGIQTTHAAWQGMITGTAREILGEVEFDESDGGDDQEDLARMLTDMLRDNGGKMSAKMVQAEVRDAGYSWTAANRAKMKIGIESAKEKGTTKGSWTWYLPGNNHGRNHEETENTTLGLLVSSVSSEGSSPVEVTL